MESEGKERWSWGGIVRGRERGEGGERREGEKKESEGGRELEVVCRNRRGVRERECGRERKD